MTSEGTARRSVRVPNELWELALDEADRRGETVSDAVRRFLDTYVHRTDLDKTEERP